MNTHRWVLHQQFGGNQRSCSQVCTTREALQVKFLQGETQGKGSFTLRNLTNQEKKSVLLEAFYTVQSN
jgi:hypothetical protein